MFDCQSHTFYSWNPDHINYVPFLIAVAVICWQSLRLMDWGSRFCHNPTEQCRGCGQSFRQLNRGLETVAGFTMLLKEKQCLGERILHLRKAAYQAEIGTRRIKLNTMKPTGKRSGNVGFSIIVPTGIRLISVKLSITKPIRNRSANVRLCRASPTEC